MSGWQQRFDERIMRSMGMPLAKLERGDGAWVWDDAGNRYLDFLAGIAVNSLGHAHPVFVEAVTTQARRLAHVSNYFMTEPALELAERIIRLAGAREPRDALSELEGGLGHEVVRDVRETTGLRRDGLDEHGMRMPERVDGDAGEEVEVPVARVIPHPGALAVLELGEGHAH